MPLFNLESLKDAKAAKQFADGKLGVDEAFVQYEDLYLPEHPTKVYNISKRCKPRTLETKGSNLPCLNPSQPPILKDNAEVKLNGDTLRAVRRHHACRLPSYPQTIQTDSLKYDKTIQDSSLACLFATGTGIASPSLVYTVCKHKQSKPFVAPPPTQPMIDSLNNLVDVIYAGKSTYSRECHFDSTLFQHLTCFDGVSRTNIVKLAAGLARATAFGPDRTIPPHLQVYEKLMLINACFSGPVEDTSCPGYLVHIPPGNGKSVMQMYIPGLIDLDHLNKVFVGEYLLILENLVNAGFVVMTSFDEVDQLSLSCVSIQTRDLALITARRPQLRRVAERKEKADFYRRMSKEKRDAPSPTPDTTPHDFYASSARRLRERITTILVDRGAMEGFCTLMSLTLYTPHQSDPPDETRAGSSIPSAPHMSKHVSKVHKQTK